MRSCSAAFDNYLRIGLALVIAWSRGGRLAACAEALSLYSEAKGLAKGEAKAIPRADQSPHFLPPGPWRLQHVPVRAAGCL